MADNLELNPGTGGAVLAADDVGGVLFQRTKLVLGPENVNGGDVAEANPLPVSFNLTTSQVGDAFGRMRASSPVSAFEVTHQYDLAPRLMGLQRNDAGTSVTHAAPTAILAVPITAGRRICHQSHLYTLYQPGKSQEIRITGQLGDGTLLAGMGYGDDDDGIFLERTSTGMQIRLSSSTVADQLVAQAAWNVDKLDGTGASGVTLDPATAIHLVIDLQWLGVGRVRVGLSIGGRTIFVHFFQFANTATTAYMRTVSLPIRWYAESLGAAGSMHAICGTVLTEGGHDPYGLAFATSLTTAKALLAAGTRTPLLSIRPALLFNSIANRGHILPTDFGALVSAADNVLVEIVLGGTLTGATFGVAQDSASHAEIDIAATSIAGGTPVSAVYLSSSTRVSLGTYLADLRNRPLVLHADGVSRDLLTLCATRLSGAASVFGEVTWLEVR